MFVAIWHAKTDKWQYEQCETNIPIGPEVALWWLCEKPGLYLVPMAYYGDSDRFVLEASGDKEASLPGPVVIVFSPTKLSPQVLAKVMIRDED